MSTQEGSRVLPPWWLLVRDIGIFLFGIVVAAWEIKTQDPIRDSVLVFAGSLLGGPLALNTGQQALEALRSRGGTGGSSSSSPEAVPPPSVP